MPNALEFSCLVTAGRIPVEVSKAVATALRRLDGKRVDISVRKHVNKRSTHQNAYYFGVVVKACHEIFVEAGNDVTPEDVHQFLKEHVAGSLFVAMISLPSGHRRSFVRSSKTLTTVEWEDFMERCRAFAAENGRVIPLPNENLIHQGEG